MQLIFTMRDALKIRPCPSRRDGQRLGIPAFSSHLEVDNIKGIHEVAYICYEQLCYCSQICCLNRASFSSSFEAVNKVMYRSINLFSSRRRTSRSPSRPSVSVVSSMCDWKLLITACITYICNFCPNQYILLLKAIAEFLITCIPWLELRKVPTLIFLLYTRFFHSSSLSSSPT